MGGKFVGGFDLPALVVFKPPRRHEECRICNQLSRSGDTYMLYDNHLSNYPSGCPRFIGMTISERSSVVKAAKICLKCHDPAYTYSPADGKHKCPIKSNAKSRYTCRESNCNFHNQTAKSSSTYIYTWSSHGVSVRLQTQQSDCNLSNQTAISAI